MPLHLKEDQNKIKYVPVAVDEGFEKILTSYLVEKQSFK